jgi:YbbR domain-containing protein
MIAFLRHLFFDDFWLKLFSFVLAVLIWITVSLAIQKEVSPVAALTTPLSERTLSHLPVLVMSPAAEVRSFQVSPGEVEVTVQGDARILQKLQNKDIRVTLDLTGIEEAQRLRKRIDVATPPGVTLVSSVPEEVKVTSPPKR